jgi:phosphoribosylformimino-5-aminoimidazole carboxamide ribotide isomerase
MTVTPALYPSIDLRAGRVVRLRQGDYARETAYGHDPVEVAGAFVEGGAEWIHVVDLDAARSGIAGNRAIIAAIAVAVDGRANVQAGGGVRTFDDAAALADAGVARVVMGSAAVADPALVDKVADRIAVAVALDHRRGVVAVEGWTSASTLSLAAGLERFGRAAAFVVTDIERDGELGGPDIVGIADAVAATPTPVLASGGVSSLDDVRALAAIPGLAGIITGRALYEGRFTVGEAVAAIEATKLRSPRHRFGALRSEESRGTQ